MKQLHRDYRRLWNQFQLAKSKRARARIAKDAFAIHQRITRGALVLRRTQRRAT
jgi:hypothetical protein